MYTCFLSLSLANLFRDEEPLNSNTILFAVAYILLLVIFDLNLSAMNIYEYWNALILPFLCISAAVVIAMLDLWIW